MTRKRYQNFVFIFCHLQQSQWTRIPRFRDLMQCKHDHCGQSVHKMHICLKIKIKINTCTANLFFLLSSGLFSHCHLRHFLVTFLVTFKHFTCCHGWYHFFSWFFCEKSRQNERNSVMRSLNVNKLSRDFFHDFFWWKISSKWKEFCIV